MRIIQIIILHLFLLIAAYSVLVLLGFLTQLPHAGNLNRWDTSWYLSIVEHGYVLQEGKSNVAFFPLFPYLWKFLHLGMRSLSLLNAAIFLGSFAWLARVFQLKSREILFFLSVPSFMFMYVPYSEATFFLFSTMLLTGLYKGNNYLTVTGLFLCCITRSSAVFFIPAILFTEFISLPAFTKSEITGKLKQAGLYLVAIIAAILLVALVQWQQTGSWFPFFGVQQHWGHTFNLPVYPLTTWGGIRLLWLDGAALWFGIVAGLFCKYFLFRSFQKNQQTAVVNRAAVFSSGYVVAVTLFIIFFQQHTLYSLNRYVFATPYFIVFLLSLTRQIHFSKKALSIFFLLTLPLWLLFEAHTRLDGLTHLQTVFYFILLTVFLVTTLTISRKNLARHTIPVLYAFNLLLQLYLLNVFLKGDWVG